MKCATILIACLIFFATHAGAIEIPFRWTPGQIEIPVSFDGKPPIWCILDSGAEFNMIDAQVAQELQLGTVVDLRIGVITLKQSTVRPWKLDNFRRQKRDIRGVIGYQLFERYVITVDFQKHLLILNEPATFRPSSTMTRVPITFSGKLPALDAKLRIRGRVLSAKLMVDTGASQALILRQPFVVKHQLLGKNDATTTSETVAAGSRTFVTLPVDELLIDRWRLRNPRTSAYGTASGAGGYIATDGLLGNEVLRRFRVTFDYARKQLLLEEANLPAPPASKVR